MIFRKILILFFFFAASLVAAGKEGDIKLSGDTNYMHKYSASLVTRIDADYAIILFEPPHEKWAFSLNGKVSMDYDHFGNETKINVFTTVGIDF